MCWGGSGVRRRLMLLASGRRLRSPAPFCTAYSTPGGGTVRRRSYTAHQAIARSNSGFQPISMRGSMRDHLIFWVNGRRLAIGADGLPAADAFRTVSGFLRERLGLVGTKVVCGEGDCGACTVLVGRPTGGGVAWQPIDSCIRFVFQLDGCHLVTIEGLAHIDQLAPVQQAMIDCHGSQCGFCTPGFVMTMAAACERGGVASGDWPAELAGNLCRCTGYLPIVEAGERATGVEGWLADRYPETDWAGEAVGMLADSLDIRALVPEAGRQVPRRVLVPATFAEALAARAADPSARVVAGATDLGVLWNRGLLEVTTWLDLNRMAELGRVALESGPAGAELVGGALCSWTAYLESCRVHCPPLVAVLEVFGGPQIRHAGTIGGNVVNGSPIADFLPMLYAMGADVELASNTGCRRMSIESFLTGYKQTALRSDELLARVRLPLPAAGELVRCYKISRRRDLDISTFTAAIRIRLEGDTIRSAAIAYGGVGPTVIRLVATEAFLVGRPFTADTFRLAGDMASREIAPLSDVRGSRDYRLALARNVLRKFHQEHAASAGVSRVPPAGPPSPRPTNLRVGPPAAPSVGQTIPHDSARGHVTGAAHYIDDLPRRTDELIVGFVPSPLAAGLIRAIDTAAAAAVPGVVAVITAADLPAARTFGPLFQDEPILADGEVLYVGQPVVILAAETAAALATARRLIHLDIAPAEPILTIEQAIAQGRFIGPERRIRRGEPEAALAAAPHRLAGVFQNLGQEHFYLEAQSALAWPGEDGQMVIHSSTQGPTETQHVVAAALGVGMHEVVCVCKRMGGGFGGKETQGSLPAIMAALVARQTGRAARVVYPRDDDMRSTGKRHAYRSEWEVGFDDEGRIGVFRVRFFSAGGAAADLSTSVMERSMLHADNAYFLEHADIQGQVCFTNHAPATAFRGFGGPQGMAVIENVIQEIAAYLQSRRDTGRGPAAIDVQLRNLYGGPGRDLTPYGQIVSRNHLPEIVDSLVEGCDYRRRLRAIELANQNDPAWLRGLAVVPVKFGISFTTRFLNQGNALVNVYADGTIQVSTGGTEMGQGLNTKIRQLVADAFGLPPERVIVMPTSTEKNANTSPTAASAGTDLNGAAALDACRTIRRRLAAWAARRFALPDRGLTESPADVVFTGGEVHDRRAPAERISFAELCAAARRDRVDLGARGFYATPGVDYNRETGRGHPFLYYTQGAAAAEVRIDRFTGTLVVPRVDLLIDIGRSINPGVDMGQVVGGFVQGMGWVTDECLVYDYEGGLLSRSPTTYKIPAASDVPAIFNAAFFPNDDNVETVARSKAVGEPPLMHALAVWAAVKHALACESRAAAGRLCLPATGEEILRALEATSGAGTDPWRHSAAAVGWPAVIRSG
jgi:xanthine dehydrogenase large subunit